MPTQETTIRTSHAHISVRDSGGDGLPIVLIHAPGGTMDDFAAQFDSSLAREFRLLAIDLPGHGGSSKAFCPHGTYSVSGYADAVIEVLEFLGIEDAVVVASSVCGQVALEMMASFPGIIGVMLAGAAPLAIRDDGSVGGMRTGLGALAATHQRADPCALSMLLEDVHAGNFTDGRCLIEAVGTPVAIVNGACDEVVDDEWVLALDGAHVWDGCVRSLPNVGASPYAAVPDMFNQLLRRFARDARCRAAVSDRAWGLSLSA